MKKRRRRKKTRKKKSFMRWPRQKNTSNVTNKMTEKIEHLTEFKKYAIALSKTI